MLAVKNKAELDRWGSWVSSWPGPRLLLVISQPCPWPWMGSSCSPERALHAFTSVIVFCAKTGSSEPAGPFESFNELTLVHRERNEVHNVSDCEFLYCVRSSWKCIFCGTFFFLLLCVQILTDSGIGWLMVTLLSVCLVCFHRFSLSTLCYFSSSNCMFIDH